MTAPRSRDRYPTLKRAADGAALCRGCGKPVPPNRKTWCSRECYQERCPQVVRFNLFQRDKGVCSVCGADTVRERGRFKDRWRVAQGPHYTSERFWVGSEYLRERFDLAVKIHAKRLPQVQRAAENRRIRMMKLGWPTAANRDWWEADHITPFSEGGPHTIENMRTVCVPCHKAITAAWRKTRSSGIPHSFPLQSSPDRSIHQINASAHGANRTP